MTTPTPPKASTAKGGSSATATRPSNNVANSQSTGVQAALQSVGQLESAVAQLKHEIQGYNDGNVIGRDTFLLRSFFDQILGRTMQVAQSCKINWSPTNNAASRR